MLVDHITAEVRAAQQTASLAMVMGGKPEWPDLDEHLEAFDAALVAEPKRLDAHELDLRAALGLRGHGG